VVGDDKGSGMGHHVAWRKAWEVWDSCWWGDDKGPGTGQTRLRVLDSR